MTKKIILLLLLTCCYFNMNAQQVNVKGKVADKLGPIPGVNVVVKGSSTGVQTDIDGNFQIKVEKEQTLVFKLVGFESVEKKVKDDSFLDITMAEGLKELNEVVVVGYGTQKKASLTGAISNLGAKDIARSNATTVSSALAGKIAGVNFRMSDGRPGNGTQISIRNMGTPLYVIDGVQKDEGQFNNLDFNDIESLSVLKDASAAIYGVKAANGVIVVKTKTGKRNSKNVINVNTYYGMQSMSRFPDPANAATYVTSLYQSDIVRNSEDLNHKTGYTYSFEDLKKWQKGTEKGYQSFDWKDFIFTSSPQSYIGINTSGGSENINYYLSMGNLKQDAIIRNYGGFERTNFQFNLDANITDKLKIGASTNARIEQRVHPGVPGGDDTWQALVASYRNLPTERPYANDNPNYPAKTNFIDSNFAMLNYDLSGKSSETWRVIQLNLTAEYEIIKDLKLKGTYGYYFAQRKYDNQEYTYKLYSYDAATDTYPVTFSMTNPYRERESRMVEEKNTNLQLNYVKQFGKHNVSGMIGAESYLRKEPNFWMRDRPASNSLSLIYMATLQEFNDNGDNTQARLGYVGRFNYDYDSRFLLEFSGRYDGSWKFPTNNRWGFFPSVSGGWKINNESFWQGSKMEKVVSNLKIRASYGAMGDDNTPGYNPFDYLGGYNYKEGGSVIDGSYIVGSGARGLPVTNLSWMTVKSFDIGVDFGLFNNSLSGSIDYFRRKKDGIPATKGDVLIPSEAGFNAPAENLNSEINRGFDASIVWKSKIGNVNYYAGGNVTFARQLNWHQYNPQFSNSFNEYRDSQWERYADINWGLQSDGQFQSWDEIAKYPIDIDRQGNRTLRPGDIKYKDTNGDGMINRMDEVPIGYKEGGLPYLSYGINLGADYKGFDVSMDFTGSSYNTYTQDYEARTPFLIGGNNPQYYMENATRLSDINDPNSPYIIGDYPMILEGNGGHSNYWKSDFWVHNVSYLKLKNAEIGYTLPKNWTDKARISKLRFYVSGQNLLCIDNLGRVAIDPEINAASGVNYPTMTVYNIGANLTF